MKRFNLEIAVGIFLIAGFACFAYLSVKLGEVHLLGTNTYQVHAKFGSVSGLKSGAVVEIAGVQVGKVASINLNQEYYEAMVNLDIDKGVEIPEDSIAAIRTSGIIGDKFVSISPGGATEYVKPEGEIAETQSAINLEELVSKYIFEKK
jgi:phospholipid/cholesterol/gamma-HCH transport system substrate-binding protein